MQKTFLIYMNKEKKKNFIYEFSLHVNTNNLKKIFFYAFFHLFFLMENLFEENPTKR